MKTPANTALALLKSRTFWIVVIILVAAFIVWKNWAAIERLFKRDVTDYTGEPTLTAIDKQRLDELASDLFAEFDGLTWSTAVFEQVVPLNNSELRYLAERYKHYSGGESLSEAIGDEAIAGDDDGKLISRLNAMNL